MRYRQNTKGDILYGPPVTVGIIEQDDTIPSIVIGSRNSKQFN